MRAIVLATLISSLFLFNACTRPKPSTKLVHADSLMQKHPDSALHFLQSIPTEELTSLEDRAYYALLMTQARDKNFILQTNDSLIYTAVQYYDSMKITAMQAKAYYYWGCIWRDKEDYSQALNKFFTAISYTQKIPNHTLAGHIYNNIANLYYMQRLDKQADSIYQITEKLAINQRNTHLHVEVLSQRAMIDLRRRNYDKAEQVLIYAYNLSCQSRLKSLIAKTSYSLSLLYGRMNNGEKAVEFARLSINNQENVNMLYRTYLILGDAYYKSIQYDSALVYLNKGLHSKDYSTKAGVYLRLADIAQKQGNLKEALKMERKYSTYLDSIQQKQQSSAIIKTEKDMLIQRKQSEYNAKIDLFYYYFLIGFAAFMAIFIVLWKKHKKEVIKLKQKEIELDKIEQLLQQKNEQIASLQKEIALHNNNQAEKQNLNEELNILKTERQALLKEAYEHSEVYVKMKRIIQSYKKTDKSTESFDEEDWRQLIAETDMRWNNITLRLATKYPLSLDEIYLCCLHLTDIPTSHFRYIMECSRDAIYKKSKKILEQKMKCSDKSTSLRDILEQFLRKE